MDAYLNGEDLSSMDLATQEIYKQEISNIYGFKMFEVACALNNAKKEFLQLINLN